MEVFLRNTDVNFRSEYKGSSSEYIFNFSWSNYFPLKVSEDLAIEMTDYEEVVFFLKNSKREGAESYALSESVESRERYYKVNGDFFKFKFKEKTIGVFVGTPLDWSSYYIRYVKIDPDFRGRKIYQALLLSLIEILKKHGVNRIESDVPPTNLPHIHVLNKFEFNVVGSTASERWGLLLKFVKFLNPQIEVAFIDRFCLGLRPQLDEDLKHERSIP